MDELARIADQWQPEPELAQQVIDPLPARALAALLDQPADALVDGAPVPPLWTALYFLERAPQRELGADGHPRDGRFLPPVPQRRRMFGGGRLDVMGPLHFGESVTRRAEMSSAVAKSGRSGDLLFVTVRQTYSVDGDVRLIEEQDLVYRSAGPDAPAPSGVSAADLPIAEEPAAAPGDLWTLPVRPDPVMLFRFSALTYNAHRIHYDQPYATGVEGLPGLLVHGPLLVVLALELPRRYAADRSVRRLSYRARRPVTVGQPILAAAQAGANEDEWLLEIRTGAPGAAMTATVEWGAGA